ncbi:hypothetical protein BCAR13_1250001 [Paraburkholderia caribensis]|nr:hypothetical protein BCAR13_1250001 [Paraburkholderia caribensis]
MVGTAGAETAEAVTAGAGRGNRPPCFPPLLFAQETKVTGYQTGHPIVQSMKREIPCGYPLLERPLR